MTSNDTEHTSSCLAVPHIQALRLLQEAARTARDVGRDPWDFALELGQLCAAGLGHNDLRRLLCQGYVAAAEETTRPRQSGRAFRPSTNLCLTPHTCFVLAPAGEVLLHQLSRNAAPSPPAEPHTAPTRPRWDPANRTLYWGHLPVKRYSVPAPNQERILSAFEEEGWPPHLDDPLSGAHRQDAKQRLHDTIKNLNRHQLRPLIRFRGDGTGEGVRWEADPSFPTPSPDRP